MCRAKAAPAVLWLLFLDHSERQQFPDSPADQFDLKWRSSDVVGRSGCSYITLGRLSDPDGQGYAPITHVMQSLELFKMLGLFACGLFSQDSNHSRDGFCVNEPSVPNDIRNLMSNQHEEP